MHTADKIIIPKLAGSDFILEKGRCYTCGGCYVLFDIHS